MVATVFCHCPLPLSRTHIRTGTRTRTQTHARTRAHTHAHAHRVSQLPLVIYTSNMFAIISLRSLFSIVAHAVNDLPYLQKAIGLVLVFVGLKMVAEWLGYEIAQSISLAVVLCTLAAGTIVSIVKKRKENEMLLRTMSPIRTA